MYPEHLGVTIRFSVDMKNTDSLGYSIAQRLLSIYEYSSLERFYHPSLDVLSANYGEMLDWLEKTSPEAENASLERASILLERQKKWCIDNQVFFTPFLTINGVSFPDQYDISDLQLVLNDLIDFQNGELQFAV